MKKMLLKTAVVAMAASVLQTSAIAAEVTLRFSHFFPAVSTQHKELFQVWADKVEADSKGRIAVELYPSATLAKPGAQYDAVKNRIADVSATLQGYTANRFPLTQVVELPGVATDAENGSCVIQSLYDEGLLAREYTDTHPLFVWTHGLGHIHTTEKKIEKPEDLAGLRIRRPTAVVAKMLEGLGAQPVGMPAPESFSAVQKGVIDGVTLPWEGQLVFRLNDVTNYHTEIGIYQAAFIMTMNSKVYNKLPADLKKVIDDNSGMEWAKKAGVMFDGIDARGRAQAVERGHEFVEIEGGINNPDWKPVLDKVTEEYLAELEAKGMPARKVYARALELSSSCQ